MQTQPSAAKASTAPGVAVVLLNYCGSHDTLACIDSLFASTVPFGKLIVADNGSPDGSLATLDAQFQLRKEQYARAWSKWSGAPFSYETATRAGVRTGQTSAAPLVLLDNQQNIGFAAGNNVAIELALRSPGIEFVWLLNNDTVVSPTALQELIDAATERPDVGLWGATVVYFDEPDCVQARAGGTVSWMTAQTRHIDTFVSVSAGRDDAIADLEVERKLDYVLGASMFARRKWVEQVGPLNEKYFLYYEELDWAARGCGTMKLGYARKCKVLHKEGASIGTAPSGGSNLSLFHLNRSRMLFARQHMHASRIAFVLMHAVYGHLKLVLKGRLAAAGAAWYGMVAGLAD